MRSIKDETREFQLYRDIIMKVNIGKYPKKTGKERKVSIKIENHDVWDFNSSVGLVLLEWLKAFRAYDKHGIPADMPSFCQTAEDYDTQLCFDFYKESNPPFSQSEDEWAAILDKIIWSFEEMINEPNGDCYWDVKPKIDFDATFAGHSNPDGYHETIWKEPGKFNRRKHDEYQNKIQDGLDLFCKYLRNLWD